MEEEGETDSLRTIQSRLLDSPRTVLKQNEAFRFTKRVSHCRGKGQENKSVLRGLHLLCANPVEKSYYKLYFFVENESLSDIFERRDNGIRSDFYEHPFQVSETDREMNLIN